jgi:2-polyprenyl-3-methyl-5-hydroxy-6-metoxy-1,4-benzoquinol methylase
MNEKNYTVNFGLAKLFDKIVFSHRKKMYNKIFCKRKDNYYNSILDLGSTSDISSSSNAFLGFFSAPTIISVSDQDITRETRDKFPHVEFIKGDALQLNLESASFDLVFSNAVLEHVGDSVNIMRFISESLRIAKSEVILITPNRWFPFETHTKLFFFHWLPKKYFRNILKMLRLDFFAHEKNLNLLSTKNLIELLDKLNLKKFEFTYIYFLGFPSNIVLRISK